MFMSYTHSRMPAAEGECETMGFVEFVVVPGLAAAPSLRTAGVPRRDSEVGEMDSKLAAGETGVSIAPAQVEAGVAHMI